MTGLRVHVPEYMGEVVSTLSQLARQSPHINQRSGVSVRLSVSNHETSSRTRCVVRCVTASATSCRGCPTSKRSRRRHPARSRSRALEEGRDGSIIENLVKASMLTVFKDRFSPDKLRDVITAFDEGRVVTRRRGRDVGRLGRPARKGATSARAGVGTDRDDESPAAVASAVEFVLEGLHLSKRLNKDASGARATYRSRG